MPDPSTTKPIAALPRHTSEFHMLQFIREEEGATAIEYGLIASLIAVFIIVAVGGVGSALSTTFTSISTHL